MDFNCLKIKEIEFVVKFNTDETDFKVQNRHNHIIGIQLYGSAIHYFKNKKFIMDENCVYFLNQNEDYAVKVLEKGLAFSIHFTTYEPIDTESFCIKAAKTNEIVRILNIVEKEFLTKEDELALMSHTYAFCAELNKIYQKSYSPRDKRITAAEHYINAHFTKSACLAEAAAQSALSRRRFNELFKNSFGMTPNTYLVNLRLDYAKKLLKANYFSISTIAEMCGFSDIYYFSKVFKNKIGVTPTEYKSANNGLSAT